VISESRLSGTRNALAVAPVNVERRVRHRPVAATVLIDTAHLRGEMEARGITGRDLAKETGISEGTIYNALGRRPILLRNAKLIAGALQRVAVDPALSRLVLNESDTSRGELPASRGELPASRGGQVRRVEVDVPLHHAHR
jgi:lambda repressor-like predicted transcriptional regulator